MSTKTQEQQAGMFAAFFVAGRPVLVDSKTDMISFDVIENSP